MDGDSIKVAVRVRPLLQKEIQSSKSLSWKAVQNGVVCCEPDSSGTPYYFDRVFEPDDSNFDIHEEVCDPVVQGAMDGFHGTVFAYGQSGSGKTYTISGNKMQSGILGLAMNSVFRYIEQCPDREFLLRISYMEIYNEKIIDLLTPENEEKCLKLQEDPDHQISVVGLTEINVKEMHQVVDIIKDGDEKRKFAETKMNERSSRSHSIFRIIIESRVANDIDSVDPVRVSHLNFVDLAGSEKAGENSGDRFREGCAINKSLLVLSNVIRVLSEGDSNAFIGYRDSKLTRILQNALGGNSKTVIICTISPFSVEESHSTLRFASQAKRIQNKPKVNEVLSDRAMLKRYQREIEKLQKMVSDIGVLDMQSAKEDLENKLKAKEQLESKQQKLIDQLRSKVVVSSTIKEQSFENKPLKRRYSWAGAKAISTQVYSPKRRFAPLMERSVKTVGFEDEVETSIWNGNGNNMSFCSTISEMEDSYLFALPPSDRSVTIGNSFFNSAAAKQMEWSSKDVRQSVPTEWIDSDRHPPLAWFEMELAQIRNFTISEKKVQERLQNELESANLHIEQLEKQLNKESLANNSPTFDQNRTKDFEFEFEIQDLHGKLETSELRCSVLTQENQKLENIIQYLKVKGANNDQTKEQLSSLETEESETENGSEVCHSTELIQILREEIANNNEREEEMEKRLKMLQQSLDNVDLENKQLVVLMEKQKFDLTEKNEMILKASSEGEVLEQLVENLKKVKCQQEEVIEQLRADFAKKNDTEKPLTSQEIQESIIETLEQEVSHLKATEERLNEVISNRNKSFEELQTDEENKNDASIMAQAEQEALIKNLQSGLDEKIKLLTEAENTAANQEKMVNYLRQTHIELVTQIEQLKLEFEEQVKISTEAENAISEQKKLVDVLQQEKRKLEMLTETNNSEFAEKNDSFSKQQALDKLVADLKQEEMSAFKNPNEKLKAEIDEKERTLNEMQTTVMMQEDLVDKLTMEQTEMRKLTEQLTSDLAVRDEMLSKLQSAIGDQDQVLENYKEEEMSALKNTNAKLTAEIDEKERALNEMQTTVTMQEDLVDKLTMEQTELRKLTEQLTSDLAVRDEMLSKLQSATGDQDQVLENYKEEEMSALKNTNAKLTAEIDEKERALNEMQTTVTMQEDLVDKLTMEQTELQKLTEQLTSDLAVRDEMLYKLQSATGDHDQVLENYKEEMSALKNANEKLKAEIDEKERTLNEMQSTVTIQEDLVDKLTMEQSELKKLTEQLTSDLAVRDEMLYKLQSATGDQDQVLENYKEQEEMNALKNANEKLKAEIDEKERALNEMQTTVTMQEDLVDKFTMEEMSALKYANEKLTAEIDEKERALNEIQSTVTIQEDLVDKLTVEQTELEKLTEQLTSDLGVRDEMLSKLQSATGDHDQVLENYNEEEMSALQNANEKLKAEIDEKERTLNEMQSTVMMQEDLVNKLTVEQSELKKLTEQLTSDLAVRDEMLSKLQSATGDHDQVLENYKEQEEMSALKYANEKLTAEIDEKERALNEMQSTVMIQEDLVDKLTMEQTELEKLTEQLTSDLAVRDEMLSKLQSATGDHDQVLENYNEQEEMSALQNANEKLKAEIDEKQRTLNEMQSTVTMQEDLVNKLTVEQTELKKLTEQLTSDLAVRDDMLSILQSATGDQDHVLENYEEQEEMSALKYANEKLTAEIDEKERALNEMQSTVTIQEDLVDKLTMEQTELEKLTEQLTSDLTVRDEMLSKLQSATGDHDQVLENYNEEEMSALKNANEKLIAKIDEKERTLNEMQSTVMMQEDLVNKLTVEQSELKKLTEQLTSDLAVRDEMLSKLQSATGDHDQVLENYKEQEEMSALKYANEKLTAEIDEKERALNEMQSTVMIQEDLVDKLTMEQTELEKLTEQLTSDLAVRDEMLSKLQSATGDHDQVLENYKEQEEMSTLQNANEKLKAEIDEKQRTLNEMQSTVTMQEDLVNKLTVEQTELKKLTDLAVRDEMLSKLQSATGDQDHVLENYEEQEEMSALKNANEKLIAKIDEKERTLNEMQSTVMMQEDLVNKLTVEQTELQKLTEQLTSDLAVRDEMLSKLQSPTGDQDHVLENYKEEISDLKNANEKLKAEIDEKERTLNEMKTTVTMQEDVLDKLTMEQTEQEKLTEQLTSDLAVRDEMLSKLQSPTGDQDHVLENYKEEMSALKNANEKLKAEIDEKERTLNEMQTTVTTQEDLVNKLTMEQTELEKLTQQLASDLAVRDDMLSKLQSPTEDQDQVLENYKEEMSDLKNANEKLKAEIDEKERTLSQLQTTVTMQEDSVDKLTMEKQESELLSEKFKSELAEKEELFYKVEDRTHALEKVVADLEQKICELSSTIEDQEGEIDREKKKFLQIRTTVSVQEDFIGKLTLEQTELQKLTEQLTSDLAVRDEMLYKQQSATGDQDHVLENYKEEMCALKNANEKLTAEIDEKERTLNEMQTTVMMQEDLVDKLTMEMIDLKNANKKLTAEIDEKERVLNEMQTTVTMQEDLVDKLTMEEMSALKNTNAKLTAEIDEKERALNEMQTTVTMQEDLVDKLTMELGELKTFTEKLKCELSEKTELLMQADKAAEEHGEQKTLPEKLKSELLTPAEETTALEIIKRILTFDDGTDWPALNENESLSKKMEIVEQRYKIQYALRWKNIKRNEEEIEGFKSREKLFRNIMCKEMEEKEMTWQSQIVAKDEMIRKLENEKKDMNLEIHCLKNQLTTLKKKSEEILSGKDDTVQYKDEVIASLKGQLRRMQQNPDSTFQCAKDEVRPSVQRPDSLSEAAGKPSSLTRSGIVDYFSVCVLEGEKKNLQRQVAKLESQVAKLESQLAHLNEENTSLRHQLRSAASMNKENISLPQPSSEKQHPENVDDTVEFNLDIWKKAPPVSRTEPQFKIPDLSRSDEPKEPCKIQ